MAKPSSKITLKLLVDSKAKKVLFAEAGKDFVDFIFHIMSLPLGTVVKLLSQENMVGCLGDLYKSVESLNTQYFQSEFNKHQILNPISTVNVPLLCLQQAPANNANTGKLYKCTQCSSYSDHHGIHCPSCNYGRTNTEIRYVKSGNSTTTTPTGSEDGGYVKGVVTYMVMDNLEVKPMSTISGITLMNKFQVKDVASLEEKEVQIGLNEGLAMLKASLETKDVLTTVFLRRKTRAVS